MPGALDYSLRGPHGVLNSLEVHLSRCEQNIAFFKRAFNLISDQTYGTAAPTTLQHFVAPFASSENNARPAIPWQQRCAIRRRTRACMQRRLGQDPQCVFGNMWKWYDSGLYLSARLGTLQRYHLTDDVQICTSTQPDHRGYLPRRTA